MLDDGAFKYVYGLGRIAEVSGSGTNYYLADAQDSVMALTNSTGSVLNTYNYDVFGAVRSSTGSTANPFTFTGEQTDAASGLEYLRMRYYDPATGGFASRDQVATSNRFSYVDGDPVNLTDPSGLCVSQKTHDELMRKMAKLFAAAGDSKLGKYWKKVWTGDLSVCGDKGSLSYPERPLHSFGFKPCCENPPNVSNGDFGPSRRKKCAGYIDYNVSLIVFSFGIQKGCRATHPYFGFGLGTPSGSISWAPGQDVTRGTSCGFQLGMIGGGFLGGGVNFGGGGLDAGGDSASPFIEVGGYAGIPDQPVVGGFCVQIF